MVASACDDDGEGTTDDEDNASNILISMNVYLTIAFSDLTLSNFLKAYEINFTF